MRIARAVSPLRQAASAATCLRSRSVAPRRQPLGLRQRGIDLAVERVRAEQHEEIAGQAVREAEARVRRDQPASAVAIADLRYSRYSVTARSNSRAASAFSVVSDKPARVTMHGRTLSLT